MWLGLLEWDILFRGKDRLRLTSAGLAVTTRGTVATGARGLTLGLISGLGAVVRATSVAVTVG